MKCEACKKSVNRVVYISEDGTDWEKPPRGWLFFLRHGVPIYVCSERCAEKYIAETFRNAPLQYGGDRR